MTKIARILLLLLDVIHTVGPHNQEKHILASCYQNSLKRCETHLLRTVAFPCISTGAFGFDHEQAANVALTTIRAHLMADIALGKNSVEDYYYHY